MPFSPSSALRPCPVCALFLLATIRSPPPAPLGFSPSLLPSRPVSSLSPPGPQLLSRPLFFCESLAKTGARCSLSEREQGVVGRRGDTSLAIRSKPLISQATPWRAGEGEGPFLSEQPRPPDSNLCPSAFNIFLEGFISSLLLSGPRKAPVTASPTLSAHPLLSLSSSFFFFFFLSLKSAGDG